MKRRTSVRTTHLLAVAATLAIAAAAAACGGSSSGSTSVAATSTPGVQGATATGTMTARGFGNRTPSSDMLTSIAEGTPRGFANRTPSADIQTSIAEGTPPPFANRTPSPDMLTAIAEGTPTSGFRGGRGGNIVATAATVLAIDQTQLQTELQAPGATLASVAAAHGQDRATFRQALIDATQQRVNTAVANGTITQATADQTVSQFATSVDGLLDGNGAAGMRPPAGAAP